MECDIKMNFFKNMFYIKWTLQIIHFGVFGFNAEDNTCKQKCYNKDALPSVLQHDDVDLEMKTT